MLWDYRKHYLEEIARRNWEIIYFAETMKKCKRNVFPFGEDKRWGPRQGNKK